MYMCNVVYVQCNYIGVLVFADMALLRELWGYTYHCFMCVRHVSSSLCGCAHRVFATLYTPLTSIHILDVGWLRLVGSHIYVCK